MKRSTYLRLAPHFDPLLPVDDDALYVERGDSPLLRFQASRVKLRPEPGLLLGATGSGKSTELLRLARDTANEPDPPLVGLLPLWQQCDINELSAAQLIFFVGLAALKLAPQAPPGKLLDRLTRAYEGIVEEGEHVGLDTVALLKDLLVVAGGMVDVAAPGTGLLLGATKALANSLRGLPLLSFPGRGRPLGINDPPATQLLSAVEEAVCWVQQQYGRQADAQIALFVDGLDKIKREERVQQLFDSPLLARPRIQGFQVVYSAPISLSFSIIGQSLEEEFTFLPVRNFHVFLHDEPNRPDGDGVARMRAVFQRRFDAAGIAADAAVAGGLAPGGPLDAMLIKSGGVTRTALRMFDIALRMACIGDRATVPVLEEQDIDAVIVDREKDLARSLSLHQDLIPGLLECWRSGHPPAKGAPELLFHKLVLCYRNDFDWFRPAPLLDRYLAREYPEEVPPRQA